MSKDFARELESKCLEDPENAPIIPAVQVLLKFLEECNFGSVVELNLILQETMEAMMKSNCATIGVESGCKLFKRYITLTILDKDLTELKKDFIKRGHTFLDKIIHDRKRVAKLAAPFIVHGHNILVHSRSRVVRDALIEAAKTSSFTVYVTETSSDKSGARMVKELSAEGINCQLISDASVGYFMERMNTVLLGAEGVVESGGIINRIGTFQVAVLAKELNKPVIVLAESVKFIRYFPLHQRELEMLPNANRKKDGLPLIDYTSPDYIRLLISDVGTLTPSAVSDKLIELYM